MGGEQIRHSAPQDEAGVADIPTADVKTDVDMSEVDKLLDEIDGVLEENAETFAQEYQQRGGE